MIELTEGQRKKLRLVGIAWTPETAEHTVLAVQNLGLPVYFPTLEKPARSAREYKCLGLSTSSMCGCGDRRKVISLDEFILYLFTEVLV